MDARLASKANVWQRPVGLADTYRTGVVAGALLDGHEGGARVVRALQELREEVCLQCLAD